MLIRPLQYNEIRFFFRYIQYQSKYTEIVNFQETPICVKPIQKGCQFVDTSVQTRNYCTCVPNFRLIPRRKYFLLMPKVEMCEKCGEIKVAQKCKMQKPVCRVKHWKGRFTIWF